MKKKADNYERLQLGLHLWSGSAPHVGRTFKESQACYPIRAADHDKNFELFKSTDVWNYDGWLITSTTLAGAIVRCNVRKGTQVGILVLEADALFYHANPDLPHEEYSATDPVTVTSRNGTPVAA
ncbi:hypothetical protein [Pseudomonas sp. P8_250]|uniref:hypothetical protein n=1 Tax=Pseudomonas sp. P8_250 TaxID=3043446 RepID=UPI002A358981|nr:hypothetical protein [Pseudomonas sp. P8_250]MDX9668732.1 hypothetical protein [Pseudomonas sp. P8_250]